MLNRRGLFGAVPAAAAVVASPVVATPSRPAMVQAMAVIWGERGALAATRAVDAGMKPEHLFAAMSIEGIANHPRLNFRMPDKSMRTFGPEGEIQ